MNQAAQSAEAAEEARSEIIRLGGLQYTLVEAEIRRQRAQTALSFLPDGPGQKQLLALLAHSAPWLNSPV